MSRGHLVARARARIHQGNGEGVGAARFVGHHIGSAELKGLRSAAGRDEHDATADAARQRFTRSGRNRTEGILDPHVVVYRGGDTEGEDRVSTLSNT